MHPLGVGVAGGAQVKKRLKEIAELSFNNLWYKSGGLNTDFSEDSLGQ